MAYLFTSESVSEGHPDKLCDMISDAILDECLSIDPLARVAVETMVKGTDSGSHIFIGGEVTISSGKKVGYERVARATAASIGYVDHSVGMDASNADLCEVVVRITQQSPDISQGVDEGKGLHLEQGAGDQGLMFGYASNETEIFPTLEGTFMPLPAALAQRLTSKMSTSMKDGSLPWARPDSKSQVTIQYSDDGTPSKADTVVIAIQHDDIAGEKFGGSEKDEHAYIFSEVLDKVIKPVIPSSLLMEDTKIIINGTGRFVRGGPYADAGLTGRKIIVDTYGGMGRHGGGAFSGKDPSKVDRSAAYASRWAAKHVVASGMAEKCEIQLAYAIGVSEPVSVFVNTMGTGAIDDADLSKRVEE
ncbi:MAG: methionine adenosyltransferase, partial [Candidatus Thalassarchaeaceae archaeon]|nr:methionine adenosyltransferase [Candidatus Thalassarchaeaceae archaeon]